MGAWIEIDKLTVCPEVIKSLPVWERGLKFVTENYALMEDEVAPCVGAWIEIYAAYYLLQRHKSLPVWERGLK